MSKVAITGSGFVGRAWAINFSHAGHDVALWDENPQTTRAARVERAASLLRSVGHAPRGLPEPRFAG